MSKRAWVLLLALAAALCATIAFVTHCRARAAVVSDDRPLNTSEPAAARAPGPNYTLPLKKEVTCFEARKSIPRLVYKHLSKTAGTLTWSILTRLNNRIPHPAPPEFVFGRDTHNLRSWSHERPHAFVVGSIRNVCSLYQSQWRYSARDGCRVLPGRDRRNRCFQEAERGNFTAWVHETALEGTVGLLSSNFWWTYLSPAGCPHMWWDAQQLQKWDQCFRAGKIQSDLRAFGEGRKRLAHCWVRQEAYRADLLACLEAYSHCRASKQGGPLDMRLVTQIVDEGIAEFARGRGKGMRLDKKQPKANDAATCRLQFHKMAPGSNTTIADVVKRLDPVLHNLTGCCSAG
mmetsp:Transcript_24902/g.83480  ORF Transcript_24902/g.83480 Transcript_24902/m.83480 type:complete len:346 (+) Transcript_24902:123-1160(+)